MRHFMIAIVIGSLFMAAVADAKPAQRRYTNKQNCRRMTKQISHFEKTVLPMAQQRGNAMWANSTIQHLDRLKNRRADMCPEYGKQRSYLAKLKRQADQTKALMKKAAKETVKYFSGGAF